MAKTKLYGVWRAMRQRCKDPNATGYKNCGGKGIRVHPDWESFATFQRWAIDTGYTEGKSLSRIELSKDYCPENCRWVDKHDKLNTVLKTHRDQHTRKYLYKGELKTVPQLSELSGIGKVTLYRRLDKLGLSVEEALVYNHSDAFKTYVYEGEERTITEWAQVKRIHPSTLRGRVERLGWDIGRALTTPTRPWRRTKREEYN